MMSNSILKFNVSNQLKNIVSKKKKRYIADGFNLDLSYIDNNLIAMGFPSDSIEGIYRNHINDVRKFLEFKHSNHYKIYNLCSEKSYDPAKFHDRVAHYPFDDHNPPNIEIIQPFCYDVHNWLMEDPQNVAVIHCKAGKGRTGTMICSYLIHCGNFGTAEEALDFYGRMRTHNGKGVTIPSQRRYVYYYEMLISQHLNYVKTPCFVVEIEIFPFIESSNIKASKTTPSITGILEEIEISIYECDDILFRKIVKDLRTTVDTNKLIIYLDDPVMISGDIKVEFRRSNQLAKKLKIKSLFHVWFNTFFVEKKYFNYSDNENYASYLKNERCSHETEYFNISFTKNELDKVFKDVNNKYIGSEFVVKFIMKK